MKTVDCYDYENNCAKQDICEIFSVEDNELLMRIMNPLLTYSTDESVVIDGNLYMIIDTIQYPEEFKTVHFVEQIGKC